MDREIKMPKRISVKWVREWRERLHNEYPAEDEAVDLLCDLAEDGVKAFLLSEKQPTP